MMTAQAATVKDLHVLRQDIIKEIKVLLSRQQTASTAKWIRSDKVKDLLAISPGTLIQWRRNGTLTYTKVKGVYYYDAHKIKKMLAGKKRGNSVGRVNKTLLASLN